MAQIAAPAAFASSGKISGVGLARAKTSGFAFMLRIISWFTAPATDNPMKRSRPCIASASDPASYPALVIAAISFLIQFIPFGPTGVDDAGRVADDEVADADADEQLAHRDRARARAVDDDREILELAPGEAAGVDHSGQHDDRGAMLVVMEDRDVGLLPQPLLDVEAARRGDVLEVDAAERRARAV